MTAPETVAVVAALTVTGQPARFVGGCVRDAVLGREAKDIDIATPCEPNVVMDLLRSADIKAIPTGIDHGTVTAVIDREHFEITTLRHDVETYGRHAKVAYTDDWMADAERRDFTINALFCDADGTLFDPVGGLPDLEAGRIRFVGDARQRIEEDALRILRYFRFHAHYGRAEMLADDYGACVEKASNVAILSGERVAGEVWRLLAASDPVPSLIKMDEAGVLQRILPGSDPAALLPGLVDIETQLSDVDAERRLAALLRVAPEDAAVLADRLRLSNSERDRIVALAHPDDTVKPNLDGKALRRALYDIGKALFRDRILFAWADGQTADEDNYRRLLDAAAVWTAPEFPLRGADVLALGVPAGPVVGDLLTHVRSIWEEADFAPGRSELLAELKAAAATHATG